MATQRVSDEVMALVEKYREVTIKLQEQINVPSDPTDARHKEVVVQAFRTMSFNGLVEAAVRHALGAQTAYLKSLRENK